MNYNNHPKMRFIYVGIDCHKSTHTACVINCFNEKLDILTFNNSETEFDKLITMVNKHTNEEVSAIFGLEDTKHFGYLLTTYLLARNYLVKHVNSTLTFNERKKFPIISKTDELDSQCIAKVTLDYLDTLPTAKNEELYWTLKQIVKMKSAIVRDNIKIKNKLHSQLLHHYPCYKEFFTNFDCETALALWENYPSPEKLKEIPQEEFTQFILKVSRSRVSIKRSEFIYTSIKGLNENNTIYQEERNILITMLVKQIKTNVIRLKEIEGSIVSLYDKLDSKLHTIIGLTKVTSAEIISEIGNIDRFENSSKLARYAGIAPVSFSSGNKDKNVRNEYGNRGLNSYIYKLACRSISVARKRENPMNPIFMEYFYRKMSEGKNKQQAITCVMRRLINIIFQMLKNNTDYIMPEELKQKCKNEYLRQLNNKNP